MNVAANIHATRSQNFRNSLAPMSSGKNTGSASSEAYSESLHTAQKAAELSISENIYRQAYETDRASFHEQETVSMMQAAGQALEMVQGKLQEMDGLCDKASSGQNAGTDRSAIQAEIDRINIEIDRIIASARFQDTGLLDDSESDSKLRAKIHRAQELMRLENKRDHYYRSMTAGEGNDGESSVSPTAIRGLAGSKLFYFTRMNPSSTPEQKDAKEISLPEVSVMTEDAADKSAGEIKKVLELVNAGLGSCRDRLNETIDSVCTDEESLPDSEAVAASFENILGLAGQSVKAQAHQDARDVLNLLQ